MCPPTFGRTFILSFCEKRDCQSKAKVILMRSHVVTYPKISMHGGVHSGRLSLKSLTIILVCRVPASLFRLQSCQCDCGHGAPGWATAAGRPCPSLLSGRGAVRWVDCRQAGRTAATRTRTARTGKRRESISPTMTWVSWRVSQPLCFQWLTVIWINTLQVSKSPLEMGL